MIMEAAHWDRLEGIDKKWALGREKQQELRAGYFLLVTLHPDVVSVRKTVSYFSLFLQRVILTASTFLSFLGDAPRLGAANLSKDSFPRPEVPQLCSGNTDIHLPLNLSPLLLRN